MDDGLSPALEPVGMTEDRPAAAPQPAVSVVVPTMGRPQMLQRCLLALLNQKLARDDYEIIVANDRPDAATRRAVAHLQRLHRDGPALRYLAVNDGRGPAHVRNAGWRAARGALIAFTDDDTIPDRAWLADGLRELRRQGVCALGGRVIVPLPAAPTDYERDAAGLAQAEFVTANCFVRRDALAAIGGFDERFEAAWREDSDLQFTLLERGLPLARTTGAVVIHPVRPAGFGVSLRQQRKVQFDALLYKKHPRLYRQRIRARPRWDYYAIVALLITALLGAVAGATAPALAAFTGWLLATLAFSARRLRGARRDARHVAEMLLTSAAIPPLAVFWRIVGSLRFRVAFA
ncbi:glycosyltransferase [Solimonas soli]|uniref:glycosyltransferase n=1 Tax=Solimonas soli TaxID=413479 RepID=UPI0004B3C072|nr:glycosyltransferase family A protein [Solimonas soli]